MGSLRGAIDDNLENSDELALTTMFVGRCVCQSMHSAVTSTGVWEYMNSLLCGWERERERERDCLFFCIVERVCESEWERL